MSMLFVTILVDLTLARVNLDIQAMAKTALVSYFHFTRTAQVIGLKQQLNESNVDKSSCIS